MQCATHNKLTISQIGFLTPRNRYHILCCMLHAVSRHPDSLVKGHAEPPTMQPGRRGAPSTRLLVALAVLAGCFLAIQSSDPQPAAAQVTSSTNLTGDDHRMSVIPAGRVSKNSKVEVRLGVKNNAAFSKQYKIDFFVDSYSPSLNLKGSPIQFTLDPGEEELARYVWDPSPFPGSRLILYRVIEVQGGVDYTVGSGQWPLIIEDSAAGVTTPATYTAAWIEPGEMVVNGNLPNAPALVISQVYTGGGESGATYTNDFVELFNRSASAIGLQNWSIQQVSASGSDNFSDNAVTALPDETIGAGEYYLVQLASGGASGSALPTPDASGTNDLSLANGTVALVAPTDVAGSPTVTTINWNARENPFTLGSCPADNASTACFQTRTEYAGEIGYIADHVGYGAAGTAETSPAPTPSASQSLARGDDGCLDRYFNSEDLELITPAARNSSTTSVSGGCPVADADDLRDRVDEMDNLGIDTIVITYPEYEWGVGWGEFYPSDLTHLGDNLLSYDVVGTILDQAETNGQHVYVGTGRGTCLVNSTWAERNACATHAPLNCSDGPTTAEYNHVLAQSKDTASELFDEYGSYASFYGWYISHEFQLWDPCEDWFNEFADWLDTLGAEKPVLVAPAGSVDLTQLDTAAISGSSVDVFALQDSVGCGLDLVGGYATCTWDPYDRIVDLGNDVGDFFDQIGSTDKHFWIDQEVWRKPGPTYASASFAGACEEVEDQIDAVDNDVEQLTAYAYLGYLHSSTNPLNERPGGRELYDAYYDFATGAESTLCP